MLSDITVKQIGYLRAIDGHEEVTFSKLAKITRNSKTTITEKINKFVPQLDEMVREGLVTLEKANVVMYRAQ